jgi:crotonobetainyl-CoA:carnitine CoA-transferase CaiB-like acyl-CoA transferase
MGPGPHPQLSGISLNLMRNKRNVSLDLKHPDGREACLRLAERSDIVITNLRPGPLARLRLAYPDVAARKPDIVFCQAQGWPTDSEFADHPAYDDVVQSAAGVAHLYELQSGEPRIIPSIVADKVSGLTIVYTVLAALHHRDRTGEGQRVEVPMVDTIQAFMMVEHGANAIPVPPLGPAGYRRVLTAERRPQRTSDGWVHMLPYSRQNYLDVFTLGGLTDLEDDPRLVDRASLAAHVDELYGLVTQVVATRTTAEWLDLCEHHDVPCSPVVTLDHIVDSYPVAQHPLAGSYHVIPPPTRFDATPASVRRHAPTIGQDGDEVLAEVGYSPEEVAALREAGVLRSR